jgi:hypothetical protein
MIIQRALRAIKISILRRETHRMLDTKRRMEKGQSVPARNAAYLLVWDILSKEGGSNVLEERLLEALEKLQ